MSNIDKYILSNIIDTKVIQDIQDNFAMLTHMACIVVDLDGIPLAKPSNFSPFCNLIRSSKEGKKRCMACDGYHTDNCINLNGPSIYPCHTGLTDLSAPIIVNGNHIGSILSGQVLTVDNDEITNTINVEKLSEELDIPIEKIQSVLNDVISLPRKEIETMAHFLYFFANLIAKMGVINLMQSEFLEEVKEKMRYQQLLKDMKIKALQSQINPHFLFNTLNTIGRVALIENANKTETLIYALSDLLRYSLKNSDNLVYLKDELENIKIYLFIQCTRFKDRFNYEINFDENLLKCKIPVMTLQPLVENAIIHGLEERSENGKLIISGEISNNTLTLSILDNGVGIKENILNILFDESDKNSDSLGILNVHNRIQYYFGSSYGVKIRSTYGVGTKVVITLPVIY